MQRVPFVQLRHIGRRSLLKLNASVPRALRVALGWFIVFRIITAVVAMGIVHFAPPHIDWAAQPVYYLHDELFVVDEPLRAWFEPWYRWDTGWYIHIAYNGYQPDDGSIVFGPVYPYAIRAFNPLVGGDYLVTALLISNVFCIITLALLYTLVAEEFDQDIAQQTLLLFLVFPGTFFLMAGYTESMFMAFTLGAWLAMRRDRYGLAGVLALLAALTRSQGWVLSLPLAYMLVVPFDRNRLATYVRGAPAVIGGPLGAAIHLYGMQWRDLGSVQEAFSTFWHIKVAMPWVVLPDAFDRLLYGSPLLADYASLAAFVFFLILGILVTRRLDPAYALFVWPTLLFVLLRQHEWRPLCSIVRYVIVVFPLFMALALTLQGDTPLRKIARLSYVSLAFAGQIVLLALFVEWTWVA